MFRDAALTTISVGKALSKCGYIMADAHPWNILFDGCKPLFVDFGSILPLERRSIWPYMAFRAYFLFPLYLMTHGFKSVVRSMQLQVFPVFNLGDFTRLMLGRMPLKLLWKLRREDRWLLNHSDGPTGEFFDRLSELVRLAPSSSSGTTEWSAYQSIGEREGEGPRDKWPSKLRSVDQLLSEKRPETVLDIGCNKGWFSRLAANYGAKVVGMDVDEPSLVAVYRKGQREGLPVTPLLGDICQPTPAHGVGGVYRSAQERLHVDGVLSLATVHHLVFKQGMSFEAIARIHAAFAGKWLLIEFMPADDEHVRSMMTPRHGWYTLDRFRSALESQFRHVTILESSPKPRQYLLCTR
jgi:SAM-dependent methyltransferase